MKADKPTSEPTLEDVIGVAVKSGQAMLHTSLPGVVVTYDSATQLALVQPIVQFRRRNTETDELETYAPKPIPNVPVVWPAASGGALTLGMQPGDQGQIVWAERSTDEWRKTGAAETTPRDPRRHDLGDAVFVPGGRGGDDPLPAAAYDATKAVLYAATELLLGDNTATEFGALATQVLNRLTALETWLNAHTHTGVTVGAGVTGTPVGPSPVPTSVAASKVKLK